MIRQRDAGVVLINVLVILSIASIVVFLMLTSQDVSLRRAQSMAAATAADALARGAEASAVTALRRDMINAPDTDNYAEPWAQVAQQEAGLSTGRFSVRIRDAQAKLNLTRLAGGAQVEVEALLRVLAELEISRADGIRIAAEIAGRPGLKNLSELRSISAETINALSPFVDFLPATATLNLNTAAPLLLRAVLNNRSAALRLESMRGSAGLLTPKDLERVGAVQPALTGFTSQNFDIDILAEVDDIVVNLHSRIARQQSFAGQSVVVTRRAYGVSLNTVPMIPQM
ncbi:MAG: type II secretion system minor pseudopilin [Sulfitobacter sp.]|uniref:general secretion pathway protein GspK n=1 Tax=Sulfitobacter sp. TaxID=1903071 RepID=UPI004058EA80